MFAIDFDRRQSGWKRARRHDMIDGDPPLTAVEIDEIASADIDSAGAVSDRPFVQQVDVDEARQRLAQRPGIIKSERLRSAGQGEERWHHARAATPSNARHGHSACAPYLPTFATAYAAPYLTTRPH